MKFLIISVAVFGSLLLSALVAAIVLIASPPQKMGAPRDLFGFAALGKAAPRGEMPALQRYPARDGEALAYRIYKSTSDRILIFIHGSSYHGAGYDTLAAAVSASGAATVVLPNLRGHYLSGRHRGDVDYIGQLEDDLVDLIRFLRSEGFRGPITLGGHSSGGGLAIRFAGGAYGREVANYLLLSPIIPTSPAIRGGDAGGWVSVHLRRLYGLLILNMVGVHGFDVLPIAEFNKPAEYWDGTETLTYSYRLNASYHPRFRYGEDLRALPDKTLVLVGAEDEAIDAAGLQAVFAAGAPRAELAVLPNTTHFGAFSDPLPLRRITEWLAGLPPAR